MAFEESNSIPFVYFVFLVNPFLARIRTIREMHEPHEITRSVTDFKDCSHQLKVPRFLWAEGLAPDLQPPSRRVSTESCNPRLHKPPETNHSLLRGHGNRDESY